MSREATYSNIQVLRGSRENETIYSNFCAHLRRSEQERARQRRRGCGGEPSRGKWSILYGKSCVFFLILGVSFLVTLVLLMIVLLKVSALRAEMEQKHDEVLIKILNATSALRTEMKQKPDEVMSKLLNETAFYSMTSVLSVETEKKHDEVLSKITNKTSEVKPTTSVQALASSGLKQSAPEVKATTSVQALASSGLKQSASEVKPTTSVQALASSRLKQSASEVKPTTSVQALASSGLKQSASEVKPTTSVQALASSGLKQTAPEVKATTSVQALASSGHKQSASEVKATTSVQALASSGHKQSASEVKPTTSVQALASSGLKQSDSANYKKMEEVTKIVEQLNFSGAFDEQCLRNEHFLDGKCYYFSSNYSDWHKANESCASKGFQLAVIGNTKEKAFIERRLNNTTHWIGDQHKATLVNGTTANTTQRFLAFHNPNDTEKLACGYPLHNGSWINVSCAQDYKWICQMTLLEYLVSILKAHFSQAKEPTG